MCSIDWQITKTIKIMITIDNFPEIIDTQIQRNLFNLKKMKLR